MHRVVCCYPDYERLLGAAAQRAGRLLVFSYPPRNAVSRLFISAENLAFKLLRREYRSFAHPPSAMLGLLGERGLRRRSLLCERDPPQESQCREPHAY